MASPLAAIEAAVDEATAVAALKVLADGISKCAVDVRKQEVVAAAASAKARLGAAWSRTTAKQLGVCLRAFSQHGKDAVTRRDRKLEDGFPLPAAGSEYAGVFEQRLNQPGLDAVSLWTILGTITGVPGEEAKGDNDEAARKAPVDISLSITLTKVAQDFNGIPSAEAMETGVVPEDYREWAAFIHGNIGRDLSTDAAGTFNRTTGEISAKAVRCDDPRVGNGHYVFFTSMDLENLDGYFLLPDHLPTESFPEGAPTLEGRGVFRLRLVTG